MKYMNSAVSNFVFSDKSHAFSVTGKWKKNPNKIETVGRQSSKIL